MASLTTSNVRTIKEWVEGSLTGKRRRAKRVEVYGVTVGGDSNKILATAFGLRVVEEVSFGYHATTNAAIALLPSPDGTYIKAFTAVNNSQAPADLNLSSSATPDGLYFVVKGY